MRCRSARKRTAGLSTAQLLETTLWQVVSREQDARGTERPIAPGNEALFPPPWDNVASGSLFFAQIDLRSGKRENSVHVGRDLFQALRIAPTDLRSNPSGIANFGKGRTHVTPRQVAGTNVGELVCDS